MGSQISWLFFCPDPRNLLALGQCPLTSAIQQYDTRITSTGSLNHLDSFTGLPTALTNPPTFCTCTPTNPLTGVFPFVPAPLPTPLLVSFLLYLHPYQPPYWCLSFCTCTPTNPFTGVFPFVPAPLPTPLLVSFLLYLHPYQPPYWCLSFCTCTPTKPLTGVFPFVRPFH